MKKILLALVMASVCTGGMASAQGQPQPLTVHVLKEGSIYWIEGGGGNTGVIIGRSGVVVVDSKTTAAAGRQVVEDIGTLTSKPITHLIYTHSDGDHVNGSVSFPDGITIIGHENEKAEMEAALRAGGRGAPPANRLPTQTVSGARAALTLDGVNLVLLHSGPAHTNGDLVVYLPDEGVVFTGDLIATQRPDPIIHLEKHGSSEGWIKAVHDLVNLDATSFVPGHGDVQTKAQIQQRLTATEQKRNTIVPLVRQGKTLDEIRAAVGEPQPAAAPGGGRGRGPGFGTLTDIVYAEMTRQ